jgi:hypothetical protein
MCATTVANSNGTNSEGLGASNKRRASPLTHTFKQLFEDTQSINESHTVIINNK